MKLGRDLSFLISQDAQMGPQDTQMWPAEYGGSNGTPKKFPWGLGRFDRALIGLIEP